MSNGNQSAFPLSAGYQSGDEVTYGLTKREYFAAMAMQSALAGAKASSVAELPFLFGKVAEYSVGAADALLAELAK